jgi:hypothetical protein
MFNAECSMLKKLESLDIQHLAFCIAGWRFNSLLDH